MHYYAEINNQNIIIGISQLNGVINMPNMILIENYDSSLIGKKYVNGEFVEAEKQEQEQPLSENELWKLEMASNLEYLICIAELNI